jgi:hypothetical protein
MLKISIPFRIYLFKDLFRTSRGKLPRGFSQERNDCENTGVRGVYGKRDE